ELSVEIEKLKEADLLKRSALSTLENQLEAKRLELAGKEKLLAELENSLYGKEREISESEKHVAILKTAIDNRRADIERLSAQQSDFDKKNEDLITKLGSFDTDIGAFSSGMSGLTDELGEKRESLLSIELSIGDKESRLEEKRKELFRVSEVVSQKRNELHKLQSSFETLRYRESASAKDFEAVRSGIAASEESITAESERINALRHRLSAVQSEKDALKVETENLNRVIESKKDLLASEREALASNMARVGSLKELAFDKSLMDVLTEAVAAAGRTAVAGETSGLSADCPVLSDIISTEKEYEKAIEAALSERINSILLKKIDDVLAATAVIRERNLARTALLYTGFNFEPSTPESEGPFDGIIGKASDFISFENKELQVPAGRILENTLIARDLQSAIEFRNQKTSRQYALVTLDGEVVDRDGVILAGQGKDILKRKREIKELSSAVLKQQSRINAFENDLSVATSTLSGKNELLTNEGTTLVAVEKELTVAEHSMKSLHEEAERKQRKVSFLNSEIATISGEKESLETLIAAKSEEIALSEKERDSVNETIDALQESIGSVRTEYEAARSEVTDLQLEITSHREKIESLQREKANIAGALKDLDLSREAAFREADEAAQRLSKASFELQGHEEAIKAFVVGADVMRRERAAQKEAIDTESQALIAESNSLRNIRFEIDALSSQLAGANAKAIENRLRAENVESSIAHKYGVAIKDQEIVTEGFDPSGDEEQVNQLNEKIRDLGPVNLGTIEEYEELKNRYDFLTKQQQDLTLSIAELEEAISRINASTRRKLREAYDALRAKFSEVFQTLFGGGRADIVLTDEDNILESGIEIIAQPPGKKLQNLNLLSGGEKALTSLSLLFAGFLIKPSPLCILDEVDAPLD
ncbi:MAG TPA: hypothetical protein VJW95_02950, partial [Dissulfurispiraceae bacterium]|nr:hypothetical protein [Dissulfurispiraceae bacterium]